MHHYPPDPERPRFGEVEGATEVELVDAGGDGRGREERESDGEV